MVSHHYRFAHFRLESGLVSLKWELHFFCGRRRYLLPHVAKISQLIFLSPFISLLLIDQILAEPVHSSAIISLGLIVLGVALVNKPTPER